MILSNSSPERAMTDDQKVGRRSTVSLPFFFIFLQCNNIRRIRATDLGIPSGMSWHTAAVCTGMATGLGRRGGDSGQKHTYMSSLYIR